MERYTSTQPQTFASKLENFWFYHKYKVLCGILILVITLIGVHSCISRDTPDLYVLYMLNGGYTNTQVKQLSEKLEGCIDDLNGDGKKQVQVITISFSDVLARNDRAQEATLTRLVGQIASGPALLYLFDEANYTAIQEADVPILADIHTLADADPLLEDYRYNVTKSGFLADIEGFSDKKEFYFGLRKSDNIDEHDSRFPQIAQSASALKKIMAQECK